MKTFETSLSSSQSGMLLLNNSLELVASNQEAIQILSYPDPTKRLNFASMGLARRRSDGFEFIKEFKSGRRKYVCRSFQVNGGKSVPLSALLFDRCSVITTLVMMEQFRQKFHLTQRETETIELLVQGLTSKEIATRMGISPNTVKTMLHTAMIKVGASTRAGVLGKIIGAMQNQEAGERHAADRHQASG
jgi:DNA-binding CsgD family transcriptional regulator